jgi:hypothetical protein
MFASCKGEIGWTYTNIKENTVRKSRNITGDDDTLIMTKKNLRRKDIGASAIFLSRTS